MERRDFLKIAGVTGAGATTFGCSPKATEKLIPYLVPQEEVVPGVATWYATVSSEEPEGLGIQVKTREGRPILIQGNPAHPLSGGAVSAIAQAGLQGLYDPDRVKGPAVRTSAERFRAVGWPAAERLLERKLSTAAGGVYFLGGQTTGSLDALLDRWLSAFGSPNRVAYEPFAYEPVLAANRLVLGQEAIPTYDIARARYLISFGADFLETWVAPTFFARGFSAMHAFRDGRMGKFVHVEPRLSMTATRADEWLAPRPGTEMLVALAMANALGGDGGGASGVPLGDYAPEAVAERTDVPAQTIRRIAREFAAARPSLALGSGVANTHRNATATWAAANVLNQVAGNVGETVRFGPNFHVGRSDTYRAMEELVGRMRDGRVQVLLVHGANPVFTLPPALGFAEALRNVPFKVSLSTFYDETAAYADLLLPASHGLESWGDSEVVDGVRALQQPVTPPLYDTRVLGDILLRSAHAAGVAGDLPEDFYTFLRQQWGAAAGGDAAWTAVLSRGVVVGGAPGPAAAPAPAAAGAVPGAADPLGVARPDPSAARTAPAPAAVTAAADTLAASARAAGPAPASLPTAPGRPARRAATFAAATAASAGQAAGGPAPTQRAPAAAPQDTTATSPVAAPQDTAALSPVAASPDGVPTPPAAAPQGPGASADLVFQPAEFDGDEDGLYLMAVPTIMFHDGRGANKPWMQELPDPVSRAVWGSWVEIHPDTARRLGVREGDAVELTSPYGRITVPAFLYPGIRRDTVAVPIGQGHSEYGRFAKNRGANPIVLLPPDVEPLSGGRIWFGTRVTLSPGAAGEADTRLIELQGSPHQYSRGLSAALSLPEAREVTEHPEVSETAKLMEEIVADAAPESPYRWGMTIDLAKCVGCASCVTACYMENNVATVGPDDCAKGRELAWLRIERYWDEPDEVEETGELRVRYLPMLCQHCGHAPCEPVCPVYAAYHNPEGLNAQVYNRCVGTRYCANNCPYKVRKFNFFEYTAAAPLNLQYNPDVTVRSKGVMEKCTFCVQRIRDAKLRARGEGRMVGDGEVVTACQAACPTGAIVFGNLRDPASRVRREAMSGRGYSVLASLNTHSAITYLADVVNTTRPLRESVGHGEREPSHGPLTDEKERAGGKRPAAGTPAGAGGNGGH
ncbi:MAG: molybdopterin-dependent oxidoreductase [Gemmatimonadota bacterium]